MIRTHFETEVVFFDETKFTNRQKEVIKFAARGMTRKEIAEKLNIGIEGVKSHIKNITRKAGTKSARGAWVIGLHTNRKIEIR